MAAQHFVDPTISMGQDYKNINSFLSNNSRVISEAIKSYEGTHPEKAELIKKNFGVIVRRYAMTGATEREKREAHKAFDELENLVSGLEVRDPGDSKESYPGFRTKVRSELLTSSYQWYEPPRSTLGGEKSEGKSESGDDDEDAERAQKLASKMLEYEQSTDRSIAEKKHYKSLEKRDNITKVRDNFMKAINELKEPYKSEQMANLERTISKMELIPEEFHDVRDPPKIDDDELREAFAKSEAAARGKISDDVDSKKTAPHKGPHPAAEGGYDDDETEEERGAREARERAAALFAEKMNEDDGTVDKRYLKGKTDHPEPKATPKVDKLAEAKKMLINQFAKKSTNTHVKYKHVSPDEKYKQYLAKYKKF